MAPVILARPEQRWECPSCDLQQVTHRSDAHTEFHHCAGLAGLSAAVRNAGKTNISQLVGTKTAEWAAKA